MDQIQQLISANDPMRKDPHPVPDAEQELRRVVTAQQSESAKPASEDAAELLLATPVIQLRRKTHWRRTTILTSLAVAAAIAVLAVFLNLSRLPVNSPPAATATTNSQWLHYTDNTEKISFDYPSEWQVQEKFTDLGYGASSRTVQIKTAAGTVVATLTVDRNIGIAAICQSSAGSHLVDSQPLQLAQPSGHDGDPLIGQPTFVFRVTPDAEQPGHFQGTIEIRNEQPETPLQECLPSDRIYGPDGKALLGFGDHVMAAQLTAAPPLEFSGLAAAQTYTQTPEYQMLKRMLTSLRFL